MGDAAGIGPELIVKMLAHGNAHKICNPLVIGVPDVIEDIAQNIGASMKVRVIQEAADALWAYAYAEAMEHLRTVISATYR